MKNALKNKPEITFETPQATNVQVEVTKDNLVITTPSQKAPWLKWLLLSFAFLLSGWNVVFGTRPLLEQGILQMFVLILLVNLLAIFYCLWATGKNSMILTLTPQTLTVEETPYLTGNSRRSFATNQIKVIRVDKQRRVTLYRSYFTYSVQIILRAGWFPQRHILQGFKTETEPTYIVQMIEDFLA